MKKSPKYLEIKSRQREKVIFESRKPTGNKKIIDTKENNDCHFVFDKIFKK